MRLKDQKQKQIRNKKKKKKRTLGHWLFMLFMTVAAAVFLAIVGYLLIILQGERLLNQNIDQLQMPEATIIYDEQGNEISRLFDENREMVKLQDMPELLVEAFVATEDKRFWEHSGIDIISIGRALVADIKAGGLVEGGSTITQQLSRNLFLTLDKTFLRKVTEVSIAIALENKFSKYEILEMYLNRIYLGSGVYGVKAAASHYFDKELEDLDLWEIATLAGLPKAPSTLNPIANPQLSKERRAVVLQLMKEQGLITEEQRQQAAAVDYVAPEVVDDQHYDSFVDYVIEEAKARTGLTEEQLYMNGLKIYTSINTDAQLAMENVFSDPTFFPEDGKDQLAQGAMVIMDHRDGRILALIGGRDYANRGLNRALVPRQPGSSFKPLAVYAPALETGEWNPYSLLEDKKMSFGDYEPRNYDDRYDGEVTMQYAIQESKNVPAVWLLDQIGMDVSLDFLENVGISLGEEDRNLSIALGGLTNGVSPLQMAEAYSTFANDGVYHNGYAILKIEDHQGQIIYEHEEESKQVMSKEHAQQMTQMLLTVVQNGTGTSAQMNRPVAGKTGSTQIGIEGLPSSANRDIWFAGYTPEWTAAVWVGFDITNEDNYMISSSSSAAKIFSAVMSEAMKGMEITSFDLPEQVEEVNELDQISGLEASYDPVINSVMLKWEAPDTADGQQLVYRVYRSQNGNEPEVLLETLSTQVDDLSVQMDSVYEYYVTIYDAEKERESEPSNIVTVETPEEIELAPDDPFDNEHGAERQEENQDIEEQQEENQEIEEEHHDLDDSNSEYNATNEHLFEDGGLNEDSDAGSMEEPGVLTGEDSAEGSNEEPSLEDQVESDSDQSTESEGEENQRNEEERVEEELMDSELPSDPLPPDVSPVTITP